MGIKLNLVGKKFNRWTVLSLEGFDKSAKTVWICKCNCGNISKVHGSNLVTNKSKSCGCLQKESIKIKDLVNSRFGRLIVLKYIKSYLGSTRWLCLCDCGTYLTVRGYCLTSGKTKSCGCIVKKHGQSRTTRYRTQIKRMRLAKMKGNPVLNEDIISLWNQQSGLCYYCFNFLVDWHLEHKIPLNKQGTHTLENLVLSCPSCNFKKHTKTAEEFVRV